MRKPPPLPARSRRHLAAVIRATVLLGTALVAACGGGGDDSPASAAPANNPAAGAQATCGLANFQTEMLQRVNARRAAGGSCGNRGSFAASPALQWNAALDQAAAAHSLDMATRNYFAHNSPEGTTPADRASAAGYAWRTIGENIAAGYATVQAAVDAWMASDGHCANILNPAFRDIAVACVQGGGSSSFPNYWTMDLGAQ